MTFLHTLCTKTMSLISKQVNMTYQNLHMKSKVSECYVSIAGSKDMEQKAELVFSYPKTAPRRRFRIVIPIYSDL